MIFSLVIIQHVLLVTGKTNCSVGAISIYETLEVEIKNFGLAILLP